VYIYMCKCEVFICIHQTLAPHIYTYKYTLAPHQPTTQRPYISALYMYKCEVRVSHQRPTRVRNKKQHTLHRTAHCNLCIAAAACFDCNTLQHTATHCITPHHSAPHCTLQPMHCCGSLSRHSPSISALHVFSMTHALCDDVNEILQHILQHTLQHTLQHISALHVFENTCTHQYM